MMLLIAEYVIVIIFQKEMVTMINGLRAVMDLPD